jgi:hypothetical protein
MLPVGKLSFSASVIDCDLDPAQRQASNQQRVAGGVRD